MSFFSSTSSYYMLIKIVMVLMTIFGYHMIECSSSSNVISNLNPNLQVPQSLNISILNATLNNGSIANPVCNRSHILASQFQNNIVDICISNEYLYRCTSTNIQNIQCSYMSSKCTTNVFLNCDHQFNISFQNRDYCLYETYYVSSNISNILNITNGTVHNVLFCHYSNNNNNNGGHSAKSFQSKLFYKFKSAESYIVIAIIAFLLYCACVLCPILCCDYYKRHQKSQNNNKMRNRQPRTAVITNTNDKPYKTNYNSNYKSNSGYNSNPNSNSNSGKIAAYFAGLMSIGKNKNNNMNKNQSGRNHYNERQNYETEEMETMVVDENDVLANAKHHKNENSMTQSKQNEGCNKNATNNNVVFV